MVAGGMMGGSGRMAGIGAMNNIAGMMKGYQQGRKDLYEQERTQFEENMKVFEKNRTLIKEAFDRALKLAPYNLTTAQNNLRKELAGLGASIPAEMTAKSGLVQAAGQHDTFHTNTTNTLQQLKDRLGQLKAQAAAEKADFEAKKQKAELDKLGREGKSGGRKDFLNQKTGELEYLDPNEAALRNSKGDKLIEVSSTYQQSLAGQKAASQRQKERAATQAELQQRSLAAASSRQQTGIAASAARQLKGIEAAAARQKQGIEAATSRQQATIKTQKELQKERVEAAKERVQQAALLRNTGTLDDVEQTAHLVANNALNISTVPMRDREKVIGRAIQLNPSWRADEFGNEQASYRNWVQPNGAGAKQIAAFSTVAQHLDLMKELTSALDNSDYPTVNAIFNSFRTNLGHPEVTDFNTARQAVAAELVRAYSNTAGALDDRKTADSLLNPNLSPDQLAGVVDTAESLVGARLLTAKAMYEAGTKRSDFSNILPEPVKKTFGAYLSGGKSVSTVNQKSYKAGEEFEINGKKYRALTSGEDPDVEELP